MQSYCLHFLRVGFDTCSRIVFSFVFVCSRVGFVCLCSSARLAWAFANIFIMSKALILIARSKQGNLNYFRTFLFLRIYKLALTDKRMMMMYGHGRTGHTDGMNVSGRCRTWTDGAQGKLWMVGRGRKWLDGVDGADGRSWMGRT